MLHGIAVGGPLAGIRLDAPAFWDGVILQPPARRTAPAPIKRRDIRGRVINDFPNTPRKPYPGKYVWSHELDTWLWLTSKELNHK